jgi:hypothetical protein
VVARQYCSVRRCTATCTKSTSTAVKIGWELIIFHEQSLAVPPLLHGIFPRRGQLHCRSPIPMISHLTSRYSRQIRLTSFPIWIITPGGLHTAPVKPSCGCFSRQWGATVVGGGMDSPFSFVSLVRLIRLVAQAEAASEPAWTGRTADRKTG